MNSKPTTRGHKKSRVRSLALLCLMAHAFLVCLTHHHDSRPGQFSLAVPTIAANTDAGSGASTDPNNDAHCLSCRLQRNFVSDTHTASFIIAPITEALNREDDLLTTLSRSFFFTLFGRAPPFA